MNSFWIDNWYLYKSIAGDDNPAKQAAACLAEHCASESALALAMQMQWIAPVAIIVVIVLVRAAIALIPEE